MSRPKFPPFVVLPVAAIQAIKAEQRAYDRDPEGYERMVAEREERWRQEEQMELDAQRQAEEEAYERAMWEEAALEEQEAQEWDPDYQMGELGD